MIYLMVDGQQDVNVIFGEEKRVGAKIQLYPPKVVGAHDESKGSLSSILKSVETVAQLVVSLWWNL